MTAAHTTPSPDEAALEDVLLQAHQREDTANLAALYASAAEISEAAGRMEEACFRYTQAYVYALESGAAELSARVKQKLIAQGREE